MLPKSLLSPAVLSRDADAPARGRCAAARPGRVRIASTGPGRRPLETAAATGSGAGPGARRRTNPEAREPSPTGGPQTYIVKRGDTLYAIALDHGLDYRELAAWNNIENVNLIRVGQVLRLAAATRRRRATGVRDDAAASRCLPWSRETRARAGQRIVAFPRHAIPTITSRAESDQGTLFRTGGTRRPARRGAAQPAASVRLPSQRHLRSSRAPTPSLNRIPRHRRQSHGSIPNRRPRTAMRRSTGSGRQRQDRDGYSETANLKGIDIAGTAGQPVRQARAGRSSTREPALRGYGKLIIIKHNEDLPVGLRAQPGNPGEGRPASCQGPEDRRDGQHRRGSGQAAFRDPPARQADGSAPLPAPAA